jgi:hypothetical protein
VLLVPRGLLPTLADWGQALLRPRAREATPDAQAIPAGKD